MTETEPEPELRRLTLGEHLEELRAHVLRGVVSLFIAFGLALAAQDTLMGIVTRPHRVASEASEEARYQALLAEMDEAARLEALADAVTEIARVERLLGDGTERSVDERRELARRYEAAQEALAASHPPRREAARLNFLTYQETFLAHLKLCFLTALVVSLPYLMWELWRFVAEGLYDAEKRYVRIFAPVSLGCFVIGVLFNYYVLTPISLRYLSTYGRADLFAPSITVDGYLSLFFTLSIAMGLVFELPIVVIFLRLIGAVTVPQLKAFRKYFLLVATTVAAFITPTGDPGTLFLATVPLLLLYEVGILLSQFVDRRQTT